MVIRRLKLQLIPLLTGKASAVVNSDGTISRIEVIDIGAGYRTDSLPTITIASPDDNSGTKHKQLYLLKMVILQKSV